MSPKTLTNVLKEDGVFDFIADQNQIKKDKRAGKFKNKAPKEKQGQEQEKKQGEGEKPKKQKADDKMLEESLEFGEYSALHELLDDILSEYNRNSAFDNLDLEKNRQKLLEPYYEFTEMNKIKALQLRTDKNYNKHKIKEQIKKEIEEQISQGKENKESREPKNENLVLTGEQVKKVKKTATAEVEEVKQDIEPINNEKPVNANLKEVQVSDEDFFQILKDVFSEYEKESPNEKKETSPKWHYIRDMLNFFKEGFGNENGNQEYDKLEKKIKQKVEIYKRALERQPNKRDIKKIIKDCVKNFINKGLEKFPAETSKKENNDPEEIFDKKIGISKEKIEELYNNICGEYNKKRKSGILTEPDFKNRISALRFFCDNFGDENPNFKEIEEKISRDLKGKRDMSLLESLVIEIIDEELKNPKSVFSSTLINLNDRKPIKEKTKDDIIYNALEEVSNWYQKCYSEKNDENKKNIQDRKDLLFDIFENLKEENKSKEHPKEYEEILKASEKKDFKKTTFKQLVISIIERIIKERKRREELEKTAPISSSNPEVKLSDEDLESYIKTWKDKIQEGTLLPRTLSTSLENVVKTGLITDAQRKHVLSQINLEGEKEKKKFETKEWIDSLEKIDKPKTKTDITVETKELTEAEKYFLEVLDSNSLDNVLSRVPKSAYGLQHVITKESPLSKEKAIELFKKWIKDKKEEFKENTQALENLKLWDKVFEDFCKREIEEEKIEKTGEEEKKLILEISSLFKKISEEEGSVFRMSKSTAEDMRNRINAYKTLLEEGEDRIKKINEALEKPENVNIKTSQADQMEDIIDIINLIKKQIDQCTKDWENLKELEKKEVTIAELLGRYDRLEERKLELLKILEQRRALEQQQAEEKVEENRKNTKEYFYSQIYKMSDNGMPIDEIAQQVNMGKGEVRLILGLRRK